MYCRILDWDGHKEEEILLHYEITSKILIPPYLYILYYTCKPYKLMGKSKYFINLTLV